MGFVVNFCNTRVSISFPVFDSLARVSFLLKPLLNCALVFSASDEFLSMPRLLRLAISSSEYICCFTGIRGARAVTTTSIVMDARIIVAVCLFIALFHNMVSIDSQPQPPVDTVSHEIGQCSYTKRCSNGA